MAKKQKRLIPLIHPTVHVILALTLFIVVTAISRRAVMLEWEKSLFLWTYSWPEWLTPFFISVTQFGTIYLLAIILMFLGIKKKYNSALRLLLTGILAYQVSGFAKDIWGRTRPNEFLIDVVNRDYFRGPGFPSGHVALATAMAFVVGHYLPEKYRWLVPVWIIAVGISRIYLGIHAPLDIIGGFAIGWFCYMLFRHVRLYPIKYKRKKTSKNIKR
jgi:undecaprenyl-diphosphatase